MQRRGVIKKLTGIAGLAFLPKQHLFALQQEKPIHFIGLGKAGTQVLNYFYERGIGHHYSAIADPCRINVIGSVQLIPYHQLLPSKQVQENELFFCDPIDSSEFKEGAKTLFIQDHKYVLLGGLGGYTTSLLSRSLIPILRDEGKAFNAIFSRPFLSEGKQKMKLANQALALLKKMPQVHYFDNDIIRIKYGDLCLSEALKKADEEFYEEWKKLL